MTRKIITGVIAAILLVTIAVFAAEKVMEKTSAEKARAGEQFGPHDRLLDQLVEAYKANNREKMGEIINKMQERREKMREFVKLNRWHQWAQRRMMRQMGFGSVSKWPDRAPTGVGQCKAPVEIAAGQCEAKARIGVAQWLADADRCPVSKAVWVWATVCRSKTAPDKCPAANAVSRKIVRQDKTSAIWNREDVTCLAVKDKRMSRLRNGAGNLIYLTCSLNHYFGALAVCP